MSKKAYEYIGVVSTIDPDAYTTGEYTGDWVDIREWPDGLLAVFMAGTLGSSATLDGQLNQATDSSGTGTKIITGQSITQLTQAGSDSDKQALVFVRGDNLDTANAFYYVAPVMTIGTATSDAGAIVLGVGPRNTPASEYDLASVDEIVD